MDLDTKISPAFEQFLEDSGLHEKREAIVIYRPPTLVDENRVRGRLRSLRQRLEYVKERAAAQSPVQEKLLSTYQKEGSRLISGRKELGVASIGANTLPVAAVQVTRRTLPELAAKNEVVAVLPNQRVHLIRPRQVDYTDLGKAESKDHLTWGLKQLGITDIWKKANTKGDGINVAVLDTGIYGVHPALSGRLKDFVVIDPSGRRIKCNPAFDCSNHGTHVCGTIAGDKTPEGVRIGVAPECTLFVAGVLVGDATLRTLIEGISWAIEKGADIVSMSLGFTYYEPLFAEVFKMLLEQYNILPVVAIGNENHGNSSSPGNAYNALSVGAVEKMAGGRLNVASFSSGASLTFPGTAEALVNKPDVVAPGVQVFSSIPPQRAAQGVLEYTYMDGTSMATPHVAGVAALLMGAKPEASALDIAKALRDTAKHPGGSNARPDNRWGYGMIQPIEALNAL